MHIKEREVKILQLVRQWKNKGDSNIDDEPEEPAPRDCCGQSCKPCVFDVHQENLIGWAIEQSKKLNMENKTTLYESIFGTHATDNSRTHCHNYESLEITDITSASRDTLLITFDYPHISGLRIGCHLKARLVKLRKTRSEQRKVNHTLP